MTKKNKHGIFKNEMTLQKVTRTHKSQHAINLRSSPFASRSIQNTYFQHNQFRSKSNIIIIIRIYYGAAQLVLSSGLQYNSVIVDSGN